MAGLLLSSSPGFGQQFLVEKIYRKPGLPVATPALTATPNGEFVVVAAANSGGSPVWDNYTYVARLTANADTLWQRWLPQSTVRYANAVTADARGLWVLTHEGVAAPVLRLPRVQRLTNNGQVLHTTYPPAAAGRSEYLAALQPALDGGSFVVGWNYDYGQVAFQHQVLLALDSVGQTRWRRDYRGSPGDYGAAFCYTRAGTLIIAGSGNRLFQVGPPYPHIQSKLTEVEATRGDSLRGRFYVIQPPGQGDENLFPYTAQPWRVVALTDGGYIYSGIGDVVVSSSTGFLAKVDANLNLVWRYVYPVPAQPVNGQIYPEFYHPTELADGTLLVLARQRRSLDTRQPFWLYHFSATGTLLTIYPFNPTRPTTGGFVRVNQLQPIAADSTWLVAGEATTATGQPDGLYVARLRVPGLRRATPTHFTPVVTATKRPVAALLGRLEVFPNPAGWQATIRYALPTTAHQATLEVRNLLGQRVSTLPLPGVQGEVLLPVAGLPAGLYLCSVVVEGQVLAVRRISIIH